MERDILTTTDPGDLVLDPTCVRAGTGVFAPTPSLPAGGEGVTVPPPSTGEDGRGAVLIPIEQLTPGRYVYAHDGTVRRVRRVIRRPTAEPWLACDMPGPNRRSG